MRVVNEKKLKKAEKDRVVGYKFMSHVQTSSLINNINREEREGPFFHVPASERALLYERLTND
jgi:hypothetical protein